MKKLRDILEKNETVIYKSSDRAKETPENWVQSMFKTLYGKQEPQPVTPLPQFDKSQSAMPDMDAMVASEKQQKPKTPVKTKSIEK